MKGDFAELCCADIGMRFAFTESIEMAAVACWKRQTGSEDR
ncbi:hypothetical protein [Mariprofundus micogutta]|nr:hypothetical protein [Mariprofundus micogutta]